MVNQSLSSVADLVGMAVQQWIAPFVRNQLSVAVEKVDFELTIAGLELETE